MVVTAIDGDAFSTCLDEARSILMAWANAYPGTDGTSRMLAARYALPSPEFVRDVPNEQPLRVDVLEEILEARDILGRGKFREAPGTAGVAILAAIACLDDALREVGLAVNDSGNSERLVDLVHETAVR
jgi:hypothetical protein